MKETELTVQVFEDLIEITQKLKNLGFKEIRKYIMKDLYFSKFDNEELRKKTYSMILDNSFLVRHIAGDNETKLVYKKKDFDKDENVIGEEKICSKVDNFEDTLKIFSYAKLNCWCDLKQELHVFKKGEKEFCVQVVEGLGNFIEYEECKSFFGLALDKKIDTMKNNLLSLGLKLGKDFFCKKVYMKFLKTKR